MGTRRLLIRLVLIVVLGTGALVLQNFKMTEAAPPQFNPNRVLCNNDFIVDRPVDKGEIQRLLEQADTDLKSYRDPANNMLASEIIASAIEANVIMGRYRLNPKLILIKMEVESNTVWGKNRHDLNAGIPLKGKIVGTRVEWILFYGWPDDPNRVDLTKKGFTNQVNNAVRILASDFADLITDGKGRNRWAVRVPYPEKIDGIQVIPANAATAALYIYTPHVYPDKVNIHWAWTKYIGDTGCNDYLPIGPTPTASTSTVLVLDISGSMDEPHRGRRKIDAAKDAATDILNMIEQESQIGEVLHQVAIVTFSTDAWLDLPLTTDYTQAKDIVAGLEPTDRTNIGAALIVANKALEEAPADSKKIIILLSDGKTNEGLPPAGILSGPVQEAADAGTCIYTVGFGDPGDLNEDLLDKIAKATGCRYYYAPDAYQLENVYIKLRHESLGNVIGEFSGQVAQGETVTVGQVEVAPNQGELYVTLNWPGSTLDLILTDPNGRRVDENYPGVTISTFARLVYIIVANPIPGIWQAAVFGRDVPEGLIDYSAIFSTRERGVPPPSSYGPLLPVVILMLGLAAIFFVIITQTRPTYGVRVVQGYGPRGLVGFRRGVINIGRDPRNDLVLFDKKVSRHHAQIRLERGWPVIYDLRSTNGTFVNGQQITQQVLRDGDEIRVGDTRLMFQSHRERGSDIT